MGFSVAIASFIVLIGFLSFFATVSTAFFTSIKDLSTAANDYTSSQKTKLDTQLQLNINSVDTTSCNITVKDTGTTPILFESSNGYSWNTLILCYGNSASWYSYAIDNYQITGIGISGSNTTFNLATHNLINPNEQATITVNIPNGAPEISAQDIVSITFASYYGVTASGETTG